MQNETLGHRGRKADPLYRIRKLMLTGVERLDGEGQQRLLLGLRAGDPYDEVLTAWLAKESVRDVYRLYALQWGARVLMRGGDGRWGQVTPPAWRRTRRR